MPYYVMYHIKKTFIGYVKIIALAYLEKQQHYKQTL